jgi:hypothetical protein
VELVEAAETVILIVMRELLRSILDSVSILKSQVRAGLSSPLSDPTQIEESDPLAADEIVSCDTRRSTGSSFNCVDEHSGYLTGNGLGSLEVGAAHDD